jgi:hypothetical protein
MSTTTWPRGRSSSMRSAISGIMMIRDMVLFPSISQHVELANWLRRWKENTAEPTTRTPRPRRLPQSSMPLVPRLSLSDEPYLYHQPESFRRKHLRQPRTTLRLYLPQLLPFCPHPSRNRRSLLFAVRCHRVHHPNTSKRPIYKDEKMVARYADGGL